MGRRGCQSSATIEQWEMNSKDGGKENGKAKVSGLWKPTPILQ